MRRGLLAEIERSKEWARASETERAAAVRRVMVAVMHDDAMFSYQVEEVLAQIWAAKGWATK